MTPIEILTAFETEIGTINDVTKKPAVDDSLFWLNLAVGKFVKLRFNGDFTHHTGFEQTEKRREDLINLFVNTNLTLTKNTSNPSYDSYSATYPDNFLYILDENVIISDTSDAHEMATSVFECTRDSFMYRVTNSLTDFHYRFHRARPLRIRNNGGCELLTDKKYKIKTYSISYLKEPAEITMDQPFVDYTDFSDIVMPEIIKMAAQMYLENKKDERYQTISGEVLTQE